MSTYVHAVFFTCRSGTPEAQIEALADDARRMLSSIPSVRQLHCGRRDPAMTREVNDTAFDVGLVVHFDDRQGFHAYAEHPDHVAFVTRHKPNWAALRVCDLVAP